MRYICPEPSTAARSCGGASSPHQRKPCDGSPFSKYKRPSVPTVFPYGNAKYGGGKKMLDANTNVGNKRSTIETEGSNSSSSSNIIRKQLEKTGIEYLDSKEEDVLAAGAYGSAPRSDGSFSSSPLALALHDSNSNNNSSGYDFGALINNDNVENSCNASPGSMAAVVFPSGWNSCSSVGTATTVSLSGTSSLKSVGSARTLDAEKKNRERRRGRKKAPEEIITATTTPKNSDESRSHNADKDHFAVPPATPKPCDTPKKKKKPLAATAITTPKTRKAGTGISSFLSEHFRTPRKEGGKAAFVAPLATPKSGKSKPPSKRDRDAPKKKKKNPKNAASDTHASEKKKNKEKTLPTITPAEIQMVKKKIDAYDRSRSPIGTPKRSKPTLSSKRGSNHETPKKKTKKSSPKPLQSPVAPVTPRTPTSSNRYFSSNNRKQQFQTPHQTPQRKYLGAPTPKSGKKTSNVVSVFTAAKRTPKRSSARREEPASPEALAAAAIRALRDAEEKRLMNAKPIDIGLADSVLEVLRNARSHNKFDDDDDDDESSLSSSSAFSSLSSLSSDYDTDDDDSSVDISACGRFR